MIRDGSSDDVPVIAEIAKIATSPYWNSMSITMQYIEGQPLAALITELRGLAGRDPIQAKTPSAPIRPSVSGAAEPAGKADLEQTGPYLPGSPRQEPGKRRWACQ